ncbi:MAG: hypothetical protein V4494_05930 [Chlamydiota bacterium]
MKLKSFVVFGVVGLFSILTMRENYKLNSSVPEFTSLAPFTEKGIVVSYKTLSSAESRSYLSRDLLGHGYQPIHVTIQNNTADSYEISPENVSMPLASSREVVSEITKAALPRSIGFKVASLFFWPLMVPSTIDSIKTYATRKSLKKDFAAKVLKEEVLLPFSTMHRILFVSIDKYKNNFTITVVNHDSKKTHTFVTS